jgi:hypothetical protein
MGGLADSSTAHISFVAFDEPVGSVALESFQIFSGAETPRASGGCIQPQYFSGATAAPTRGPTNQVETRPPFCIENGPRDITLTGAET